MPIIRTLFYGMLLLFFIGMASPVAHAQGKRSEYERVKAKKNKKNRRLKRRGDRGKSNRRKLRATKFKIRSRQGERAFHGDITGRKFRSKRSTRPQWGARIASPNPYAGRKRMSEGSRAKANRQTPRYSSRKRERAGKAAGRAFNRNSVRTTFTGKRYRQNNMSATRDPERPRKVKRISPRSASGSYNVRRKRSPYNAFRKRSPWEKAFQGDITGRKFRTKRTNERQSIKRPGRIKYTSSGGRRGDRAYNGNVQSGYNSVTKRRERAWKNDISGHKLRIRNSKRPDFGGSQFNAYPTGKRKGDKAYRGKLKGGGFKSESSRKERSGKPLPKLGSPSVGSGFKGRVRAGKPLKGGGSISGKRRNNNGRAIQSRAPRSQDTRIAGFQGNVKGGRILKGGGSISGRSRNNRGRPIDGRGPRRQDNQTAKFQGNARGGRILKGGGSISDRSRNNKGRPLEGRGPRRQDNQTAKFQGNVKGGRVLKGGGSISDRSRNNKDRPLEGRGTRRQDNQIAKFQGNVKGGRVFKGGGSISDRSRNNKGRPVDSRAPRKQDNRIAKFQGNVKAGKVLKGGGSISGQLWNNKGQPIDSRIPRDQDKKSAAFQGNIKVRKNLVKKNAAKSANFTGHIKMYPYMNKTGPDDAHVYRGGMKRSFKYKKAPNAADESIKVRKPNKEFFKTGKYSGNVKDRRVFKQNPSAARESLKNRPAGKGTAKGMDFQGRFKANVTYKTRPHAADNASKGKGPSRAAIKASSYQGNIKMRKKWVGNRHPDFKYISMKSNGKREKEKVFSFKILWSKWFKKEENQPLNVKQKERKPRYDKKEEGLWND